MATLAEIVRMRHSEAHQSINAAGNADPPTNNKCNMGFWHSDSKGRALNADLVVRSCYAERLAEPSRANRQRWFRVF